MAPGCPVTCKSNVGCDAIDEPCTNRMVPLSGLFWARRFSHRNSLASPFWVQCSLPWMWMLSTCVVTKNTPVKADGSCGGTAKHTALRGVDLDRDLVADREDLARM